MKKTIRRVRKPGLAGDLPHAGILHAAKKLVISVLTAAAVSPLAAQGGYELVLREIEENSTTLKALREQTDADKLSNRTGIFPVNPEMEFNYLWGSPSAIGRRKDFSVSQSFDFPSAYAYRSQIAGLQNDNAELAYRSERINLLLSARQMLIELTYYNALAQECAVRLQNAERVAESSAARLETGDANMLETNKTKLALTTVRGEAARIEVERQALLSELQRLNGGIEVVYGERTFGPDGLPASFGQWYAAAEEKSPALQYLSTQVEIAGRQVKLNRAMSLPKFSAGYMREKIPGELYQGISFGMSIPLWENRNTVRQAKAEARAAEMMMEDNKIQFYHRLQNLYSKAVSLSATAADYRSSLAGHNNEVLLQKALDAGEISLLEYLLEIEYYYSAVNSVLEAERDTALAVAELSAVEL